MTIIKLRKEISLFSKMESPLHSLLQELDTLKDLANSSNSSLEIENVLHDICYIKKQLAHGHYQFIDQFNSEGFISFIKDNPFSYQKKNEEFFQFFQSLENFSKIWDGIFQWIDMDTIKHMIDLCPGSFPKVEISLEKLNFTGEITVVDKDIHALSQFSTYMKYFAPSLSANPIVGNIYQIHHLQGDLIVGNHIVDDLIFDQFCFDSKLSFSQLYESEKTFLNFLPSIQNFLLSYEKELISKIGSVLSAFVKPEGLIILTHYPSKIEHFYHLKEWTDILSKFANQLKEYFLQNHFIEISTNHSPHYFIIQKSK